MNAKEFIKHLLSIESYSFSLEEIAKNTDGEGTSLKFELARLIEKQEIVNFRKGFYLIIPPRYSKQGKIPIQLYAEKLFKSLNRNYYLGFYTAAKFHGASHQQSQQEYVMTEKPKMGDIQKKELKIRFFTTSSWSNINNQDDIQNLLTWYPHKSTLQRLGFILEEMQVDETLTQPILKHLRTNKYFPVLLSPKTNQKAGAVDNRWKVDVNIKMDSDL